MNVVPLGRDVARGVKPRPGGARECSHEWSAAQLVDSVVHRSLSPRQGRTGLRRTGCGASCGMPRGGMVPGRSSAPAGAGETEPSSIHEFHSWLHSCAPAGARAASVRGRRGESDKCVRPPRAIYDWAGGMGRRRIIVKFELDQSIEVLERTPSVLRAMLAGLSEGWIRGNYGPDTFCPFDVVGHLITGEKTDWITRTKLILEHGTGRPFSKYDRYAQFEESRGKTLGQLLDEFERLRLANLAALRGLHLTSQDLAKRGTHPALGEVTLENLLATWVAHDMNHIAQIARAMATQYENEVGPWRQYLGILKSPVTKMDADGAARRRQAMEAANSEKA